jgi:hypothetical protein
MPRTPIACRLILVMLCLLLARGAVASAMPEAGRQASGEGAKITGCRIGFDDHFKVGFWTPIWVDVSDAPSASKLSIEVATCDSDGVATTTTVPMTSGEDRSASPSGSSDAVATTLLYIKVGRLGSAIHVALLDGDKTLDRRDIQSQVFADSSHAASLRATSELVLQLGSATVGLRDALPDRDSSQGSITRHVLEVNRVDGLPTEWYGYEGVDVLVLTTADVEFCRQLGADDRLIAALERWVNLGGRLVVFCGRNAPQIIGAGKPLARLVPGKFEEVVRLPQTRSLENFVESAAPIGKAGANLAIAATRLTDIVGHVEVHGRGNDLPIVVRAPRGFGELVFVGLDLDQPPLADWPARNAFWHALLHPYLSTAEQNNQPQRLSSLGYSDLSGALRQELGRTFASVTTIAFPIVAALIMAYLVLIGPLDYLLVHKLLGRPMLGWVSFPLVVLLTCCGAEGLSRWTKGTQSHVNQAEVVDFDADTSSARATNWSALYNPRAERHDLMLAAKLPGGQAAESADTLLSWNGLAGSGLGGMHAGGTALDITRAGYRFAPQLNALEGVPVLSASTKSFMARWTAAARAPASAELKLDENGLLLGTVKNESGARLVDACLLCGQWGYRLGDLALGQQIKVSSELNPIHAKTLLSRRVRRSSAAEANGAAHEVFVPDQATADELLEVMMFYKVLGGEGFAALQFRYQSYCDLSRLLDLGRAILVASGEGTGSQLVDRDSGAALAASDDPSTVVYRVVFPVAPAAPTLNPEP